MTGLREALGVIRHEPGGGSPRPGLAQLPELAGRMRGSGLEVTVTGSAGPLPGAADLAAFRIIQEGLTNVLRHSAARSARVQLARTEDGTEIRVQNGGPARRPGPAAGRGSRGPAGSHGEGPAAIKDSPAGRPGGYGLIGLRERVAALGGTISAAAVPGGGYELRAVLPAGDPGELSGPGHPRELAGP